MSYDAEQMVLGALLLNNDLLGQVGDLEVHHFSTDEHRRIFSGLVGMVNEGRMASPVTLKTMMEDLAPYLVQLAGTATSLSVIREFGLVVKESWARREFGIAVSNAYEALKMPEAHTLADIQADVEHRFTEALSATEARPKSVAMSSAIVQATEQMMKAYQGEDRGLVTGIDALDKKLGGFKPGRMYVIGGRPGMGKTTVGLAIAKRVGCPSIIASLEMPAAELATRLMSQTLREQEQPIAYAKIENGWLSEEEARTVLEVTRDHASAPIEVISPEFRSIDRLSRAIKYAAKKFSKDNPLGLIVIDYLQLIDAPGQGANERTTRALAGIKALAMQLNVPVILLSQLSRAPEARDNKRPIMSDFRDSGSIEQDADVLIGCFREEYYLQREKPNGHNDPGAYADWQARMERAKDRLELGLLKFRQGANDVITLHCEVKHNYLADLPETGEMDFE